MTAPASIPLTVGPQGRVVIPYKLRRQLNLEPGSVLNARIENEALVLEKREAAIMRLRKLFAHIPADRSLADELIAERRAEAARELGVPPSEFER